MTMQCVATMHLLSMWQLCAFRQVKTAKTVHCKVEQGMKEVWITGLEQGAQEQDLLRCSQEIGLTKVPLPGKL